MNGLRERAEAWWYRSDNHEKMQAGMLVAVGVFYAIVSLTAVSAELRKWTRYE